MKHKKLAVIILSVILLISSLGVIIKANTSYTDYYWPAFRGIEGLKGISDAKTPITPQNIELKWKQQFGTGWTNSMGFPIEVGNVLYIAYGNTIKMLDKETGNLIKEGTMQAKTGFFSTIAYGDGKIFVPINGGLIQAFDAESLNSIWITQTHDVSSYQSLSPVTYHDGYVYMGVSNSNATQGIYFCVSTLDEDTENQTEVKEFKWSYTSPVADKKGYYWSEGVVIGSNIVFAGEDGIIVSHKLTDSEITDTYVIDEAVRSSVHYDKDLKRIYLSTKSGNIHSIKINADGTFDDDSHLKTFIANDLTSSPVTYNGRLYLGGGGASSNASFSVFNAETLDLIYSIPGIKSQSSPVLTTAYATSENDHTVYIYMLKYSSPDEIYCIKDSQGQTAPSYEVLAASPNVQYNSSTVAIGKDGTLYYKNDSSYLFALKNKLGGEYTAQDVVNAINRLPELSGIKSDDELLINMTKSRYDELSEPEKSNVSNLSTLQEAINRIAEIKDMSVIIPKLISDIDALTSIDNLTLADKENILELWQVYESLPELDKPSVSNIEKLEDAKAQINLLTDNKTVSDMSAKIDLLDTTVTMSTKIEIDKVYSEYMLMSPELQNKVTNSSKLLNLKKDADALEAEIKAINDSIWSLNPENITLADKATIEDIINRYNNLSESDRALIEYYDEVLSFKEIIDKLAQNENKDNDDKDDNNNNNKNDDSKDNNNKNNDSNDNNSKNQEETKTTDPDKSDIVTSTPKTGDTFQMTTLLILMLVSLSGVALIRRIVR